MALKPCLECKQEISTDANPCPHCGKKNPIGLSAGQAVAVVFGIIALSVVIFRVAIANEKRPPDAAPGTEQPPSPEARPAAPARGQPDRTTAPRQTIGVAAEQLYADYQANEVRADERYKGKRLLVGGKVQSIDKSAFGDIVIKLATPSAMRWVHATMKDSERPSASRLSKGDAVTVLCLGFGMALGSPILDECVFQ